MKKNNQLFWLLLGFTIFSLFFINKAYQIDDPFTLTISKAIGEHFIRVPQVFQGSSIFMDEVCDNPLFLGYYYAPIIKLFQDKEIWMHLFYLPFSLLAIISMYVLSIRFVGRGILAVLCFCVTPAFIVMSQNIMLDIPLLGLFLGALAAFIYGTDKDDKRLLFLSASLAGLASLTKYSGLLVILLMFSYALLKSKKRYLYFLLIPLFIFLLWCLHNLVFYQRIYFLVGLFMKGPGINPQAMALRIFGFLSFLSGTSICAIFLIPYLLVKKINRRLFFFSLPIGVCPFIVQGFSEGFNIYWEKGFPVAGYGNIEKSMLAVFFICSCFVILFIFKVGVLSCFKKPTDEDSLFLSFWFILLLVVTVAVQFIAARFVLLLFPPMFLLMVKELKQAKIVSPLSLSNKFIGLPILITVFISVLLAIGDYQQAGVYRDFTSSLKEKLPNHSEVDFCPDSFDTNLCYGYAFYLRKYHARGMDIKMDPLLAKAGKYAYIIPVGSFLSPVFYKNCSGYPGQKVIDLKLVGSFSYFGHVFLHNRKFHAGFYSHDWGLLPFYFSFKKVPLETFEVYQIAGNYLQK